MRYTFVVERHVWNPMDTGCTTKTLHRRTPQGDAREHQHALADEVPVEIHLNQHATVVTMASPVALADLAVGFLLSERYLSLSTPVLRAEVYERAPGFVVNVITPNGERPAVRSRSVAARSSCGLCGVTSMDDAIVALEPVTRRALPRADVIQRSVTGLRAHQPLNQQTRSVHAAAWCDSRGDIALVREDIGRHNALDKLLGARARANDDAAGYVLMSSRLSYELVQKAATHNVATLVAISAPTTLAVDLAASLGMNMVAIARDDNHSIFTPESARE
ncbi:MAG: formate dehydrogenase accessory sulfurtransferase FdhD [Gammaproteobacteria bacterium]